MIFPLDGVMGMACYETPIDFAPKPSVSGDCDKPLSDSGS
jgi:hypothetical protein